ncbi:NmrA family transcriptional regulator [Mesorhizobium sp. 1B3]|uniref:NmrA family transcriptional regulator n=1 Tax=Mesorhizobium sp. 1B3 TaxID=3243599 RepID=UPI003D985754
MTMETLITGGTGKTGQRVAERLKKHGVPVRIGSRGGTPPFDWEDRSTWEPVLRGTQAAYVAYFPDVALPGAAETVGAFAQAAVAAGARRLVLLSGRGEPGAERAEEALKASCADWTILRCAWFAQNFSEGYMLEPILAGELALPVGGVCEPFVDADDIADVAAAAFLDDRHVRQLYELTGPRLLTFADAIGEISEASGRPIAYHTISIDDFAAGLREAAVPEDIVGLLTLLFTEVLDGRNERLGDGVMRALGRPPRDFRDYARRTAAAGIWSLK